MKHSTLELDLEEKESLNLHKEIVNTKSKINVVKEYGLKLKEQANKQKVVVSDGFRMKIKRKKLNNNFNRIVLPEDIDALRDEIRELEAERDHLNAINEIDK